MNKKITTLALSLFLTASIAFSQTIQSNPNDFQPQPGACGYPDNSTMSDPNNPNPQNGNGSLGQTFNLSKCGLNYVQATRRLGRRGPLNGTPQPATYTISGMPNCYIVERAYMYASMSGTSTNFTVTITNPANQTFNFPAVTIGTGPDKCWGYGGTSSYRIDVTAAISGNGNYIVSGFPTNPPTPQKDTDGATLFIIFSDPTATYQGHMVIHDGCLVGIGGNTAQTMTGINACGNSTYARAFCMTGDWQLNGISGVWNGSPINIPWNWWNYDEIPTTVTTGQMTANYSHAGLNDCYNWVVMGLYYRTTTCTVCTPSGLTSTTQITNPTCNNCNGSVTVNVTGGTAPYTYSWNTIPPQTTQTATGLCAGTYTVYVTDATGCLSTQSVVTLTSSSVPINVTTTQVNATCFNACNGSATANASGGTSPYTYLWTPSNQTSQTASGLCAGTYTVTVTDAAGCTGTATVTITQPTQVTVNNLAGFPATCFGSCDGQAIVIAGGGTQPYSYNWSPSGGNSAAATGLCAGTYTITITDANGCTATGTVTITQPTAINLVMSSTDAHCNQSDGSATVVASGGTPGYTYSWAPQGGNAATANNIPAGTYTVYVTDANGCSTSSTVVVQNLLGVTASITGSTNATCFGACDGSATAAGNGGTAPYTYNWAPSGGNQANATGLCAGTYTVTITDANNCTDVATITITEPTQVTVQAPSVAPICIGGSATLTATASGGTPNYTYSWAPAGPNVSPTSTTTYSVYVTDANGCTATVQTVTVTVYPPLIAGASANPTNICVGGTTQLSATAAGGSGTGYTYSWVPGNLMGQTVTVSPTATTTYTVWVADNCSTPMDSATVTITVNPAPVITFFSSDSSGCAPLCVNFTNTTQNTTAWSWTFQGGTPASSTQENPTNVCYTTPGSYDVSLIVTSNTGCTSTVTINNMITVYPTPVANFTASKDSVSILNPVICFTDQSTNAASWTWNFGDFAGPNNTSNLQNPCHSFTDTGRYCVNLLVASQYGCIDSTSYCIYIQPDFTIFVPNAFTPDGDGNNDTFFPKGSGISDDKFEMWIFDRWGNMIWYNQVWGKGWDGKANGGKEIAQQDVYVWKINCYDINGVKHSLIGHVTLVK